MLRTVMVWFVWILAVVACVIAIGQQTRAQRRSDPVRVLRAWLSWVPDDLADYAKVVTNRTSAEGIDVQVEITAAPEQVRRFAQRNRFVDSGVQLTGFVAECWTLGDQAPAGIVVHLLLPGSGGPALLTVIGGRTPPAH